MFTLYRIAFRNGTGFFLKNYRLEIISDRVFTLSNRTGMERDVALRTSYRLNIYPLQKSVFDGFFIVSKIISDRVPTLTIFYRLKKLSDICEHGHADHS